MILKIVFSQHLHWHGRCLCNVQSKINKHYAPNTLLLLWFERNSSGSIRNQTHSIQDLFKWRGGIESPLLLANLLSKTVRNKYCFIIFTDSKNLTEVPLSLFFSFGTCQAAELALVIACNDSHQNQASGTDRLVRFFPPNKFPHQFCCQT